MGAIPRSRLYRPRPGPGRGPEGMGNCSSCQLRLFQYRVCQWLRYTRAATRRFNNFYDCSSCYVSKSRRSREERGLLQLRLSRGRAAGAHSVAARGVDCPALEPQAAAFGPSPERLSSSVTHPSQAAGATGSGWTAHGVTRWHEVSTVVRWRFRVKLSLTCRRGPGHHDRRPRQLVS